MVGLFYDYVGANFIAQGIKETFNTVEDATTRYYNVSMNSECFINVVMIDYDYADAFQIDREKAGIAADDFQRVLNRASELEKSLLVTEEPVEIHRISIELIDCGEYLEKLACINGHTCFNDLLVACK